MRPAPTRATIWLWTGICALEPVLYAVAAMPFDMALRLPDARENPVWWLLVCALPFALLAPTLAQWAVLRRWLPGLRLWDWLFAMAICGIVFAAIQLQGDLGGSWKYAFTKVSVPLHWQLPGPLELLQLPWWRLLPPALVGVLPAALFPCCLVARLAGMRWTTVWGAVMLATCAATLLEAIYGLYFPRLASSRDAQGLEFLAHLSLRTGIGAVWGACGAWVVSGMPGAGGASTQPTRWRDVALAAPSLIVCAALLAPLATYVLIHVARNTGFPALRQMLSVAPRTDVSEGVALLLHRRDLPGQSVYGLYAFTPDSQSLMARTKHGLERFSLETGKSVVTMAGWLPSENASAIARSADDRLMAWSLLRTEWPAVQGGELHRTSTLRLFSADGQLLADTTFQADECLTSDVGLAFEPDGKALWVRCVQYSARNASPAMALRLAVPGLRVLEVRRHTSNPPRMELQGLQREGSRVIGWEAASGPDTPILFRDMVRNQPIAELQALTRWRWAGRLTRQEVRLRDGRILLRYCGRRDDVSNPAEGVGQIGGVHAFCRTLVFRLEGGQFLEKRDQIGQGGLVHERAGWRITSEVRPDSKVGTLVVRDLATGRALQTITGIAQFPMAISPDGRWLVTRGAHANVLRIYRVAPYLRSQVVP